MLEAEVLPHAKEAEVPSVPNKSQAGSEEKKTKRRSSSLGKNLKQKWEKKTDDCTTSRYRGVTKHRRSGRWESHIWVAAKGKQIYLGGYELEEHAASAYDVVRLKIKGRAAKTNFDQIKYDEVMSYLELVPFDDLVTAVRRQSQGFAKCPTGVKWVSRHPSGRWEAKALVGSCSKFINLGLFDTEEAAQRAYQVAMNKMSGANNTTLSSALQSRNVTSGYREGPLVPYPQQQQLPKLGSSDHEAGGELQLPPIAPMVAGKDVSTVTAEIAAAKLAAGGQPANTTSLSATLASMIKPQQQDLFASLQCQQQQQP